MYKQLLCSLVLLTCTLSATAQEILGKWWNEEKTAQILVYKSGQYYHGKIIHHINPAKQHLINTMVMKQFVTKDQKVYEEGTVYDPKSGKTYSGKITQTHKDKLEMRGFVGISLFGRSSFWTRVKE